MDLNMRLKAYSNPWTALSDDPMSGQTDHFGLTWPLPYREPESLS